MENFRELLLHVSITKYVINMRGWVTQMHVNTSSCIVVVGIMLVLRLCTPIHYSCKSNAGCEGCIVGVPSIRMKGEGLPIYGPYIWVTSIPMIIVCSANNAYQSN